jgi:hypothetical protein
VKGLTHAYSFTEEEFDANEAIFFKILFYTQKRLQDFGIKANPFIAVIEKSMGKNVRFKIHQEYFENKIIKVLWNGDPSRNIRGFCRSQTMKEQLAAFNVLERVTIFNHFKKFNIDLTMVPC